MKVQVQVQMKIIFIGLTLITNFALIVYNIYREVKSKYMLWLTGKYLEGLNLSLIAYIVH